jgi:hypothetical protein
MLSVIHSVCPCVRCAEKLTADRFISRLMREIPDVIHAGYRLS